jgi:hypothetical protein
VKMVNKSFENVAKLKYLEVTITNENCMYDEVKSRLNAGNACFHSVHNLLLSYLIT